MNESVKPKKPIYKKWWFWVSAFIGIIILGSLLPKPAPKSGTESKPEATAPATEQAAEQAAEKPEESRADVQPPTPKTLGVSRQDALKGFEKFKETKGVDIGNQENYVYESANLMLQLIGREQDLSSASLTIAIDGSKIASETGTYATALLLRNLFDEKDVVSVLARVNKHAEAGEGEFEQAGKKIAVIASKELHVIIISIKPTTN